MREKGETIARKEEEKRAHEAKIAEQEELIQRDQVT